MPSRKSAFCFINGQKTIRKDSLQGRTHEEAYGQVHGDFGEGNLNEVHVQMELYLQKNLN